MEAKVIVRLAGSCLPATLLLLGSLGVTVHGAENPSTLFVPGQISTTAESSLAPAISPDGRTVCFGESVRSGENVTSTIVISEKHDGKWANAVPASFSGKYRDLEPAFAPDGKYLIFASNRPESEGGPLLDGHYNGKVLPTKGGNLWKVELTKGGWGAPQRLPASINANSSVFSPAIAGDGSLYFMRADDGTNFHLFRAQRKGKEYQTPTPVSFTDARYGDYDPAVAPDESFIVFSSGRPPAPNRTDLFIAFKTANGWGPPLDLTKELSEKVYGIEARLSPDTKTLYYTNSEQIPDAPSGVKRGIWMVSIEELIQKNRTSRVSGS